MRWFRPTRAEKSTSSCDAVREAISARLDHEEAPVSQRQLDRHLAACAACRAFHQAWDAPDSKLLRASRRGRVRAPKVVPPQLTAMAVSQRPRPSTGAGGTNPSGADLEPSRGLARRSVLVATPAAAAVAAIVAIQVGLPARVHVAPTRQPTPCTRYLDAGHRSPLQP